MAGFKRKKKGLNQSSFEAEAGGKRGTKKKSHPLFKDEIIFLLQTK